MVGAKGFAVQFLPFMIERSKVRNVSSLPRSEFLGEQPHVTAVEPRYVAVQRIRRLLGRYHSRLDLLVEQVPPALDHVIAF